MKYMNFYIYQSVVLFLYRHSISPAFLYQLYVLSICFTIFFLPSHVSTDHLEPISFRSSRRAILLKYLFFFSRSDFFKKISRTHQIFQQNQKYYKNTYKFSRRGKMYLNRFRLYQNTSKSISRRAFLKFRKNTYNFLGGENIIRTDEIFHEILSKISIEHIRFSSRKKNNKNRSNFPGELFQNFVRTDTIFQETIPPRTDIV